MALQSIKCITTVAGCRSLTAGKKGFCAMPELQKGFFAGDMVFTGLGICAGLRQGALQPENKKAPVDSSASVG